MANERARSHRPKSNNISKAGGRSPLDRKSYSYEKGDPAACREQRAAGSRARIHLPNGHTRNAHPRKRAPGCKQFNSHSQFTNLIVGRERTNALRPTKSFALRYSFSQSSTALPPSKMADAIRLKHLKLAVTAVRHGEHLLPVLQRLGISGLASLLATSATFAEGPVSSTDLATFATELNAAFRTGDRVKFTTSNLHQRMLHAILLSARSLHMAEGSALAAASAPTVLAAAATSAPSTGTAETAKTVQAKTAVKLFNLAEAVHGLNVSAHNRASYTMVAQVNAGNLEKSPVAFALSEYKPQLQVTSSKKEEISFGDKKYVDVDGAAKEAVMNTTVVLFEQMEMRMQCSIVAGTFSVKANAIARLEAPPTGDMVRAESTIRYVVQNQTSMAYETAMMDCDATPAGQKLEITAMQAFLKRNPMVSLSRVIHVVDAGVQQRIADLKMQGHTSDSAVFWACTILPSPI